MPAMGGKSLRSLRSVGRTILEVLVAASHPHAEASISDLNL